MNLTIEIKAKADKFKELYQTLQSLIAGISATEGCRECRHYRDPGQKGVFMISVHWETRAFFEHYLQSDSGAVLLGAIDLLCETARIKLDDALWEGMEVLKRMKKKKAGP